MEKSKFFKRFGIIIVLIASIILYIKIFNGFFQQDEWFGYGWFILHKNLNLIDSLKFFFYPSVSHYNPLTVATQQILFSIWGLNYLNFATLGLILHLIVIFFFYILCKRIFTKNFQALWATFIFATLAAGFQAVTWVVTDIATLSASIFGIISCIYYFEFLKKERVNKLVISILFLSISLLFKEIAIGLIAIYLGLYLIEKRKKANKKFLFIIIGFGIIYFIFRVSMIFVPQITRDGVVTQYLSVTNILYNFLTIPLKNITYIFIQPDLFKSILMKIGIFFPVYQRGIKGSPAYETFVVRSLMEIGSILIGSIIILLGVFNGFRSKKKQYKFVIFFGFLWTIVNSFIFALSPGTSGITLVPDSRNLYFLSIGIALILANIEKRKIFVGIFILVNIFWLETNINYYVSSSQVRKDILNQIKRDYPSLPPKVIFYVESDSSYYGLPEDVHILPFQSGFGQSLLAWYEDNQNFPTDFFKDNFLWDIKSQGYKEIDGRGFGYFRDFSTLTDFLSKNKVSIDNIIGYSYNSKNQILLNITKNLEKKLEKYEKK